MLSSLCSLGKQLKFLPLPLLAGAGSMIVCLFFLRDDGPVYRVWPFLWLFSSATLLIASRWYLSRCYTGGAVPAGWHAGSQSLARASLAVIH